MVNPLEDALPGLAQGGYRITSPGDKRYNCIAWAAGDTANWWWPVPPDVPEVFWPPGVARVETLDAFRAVFASLGYAECPGEGVEPSYEKIAIFTNDQGIPLHVARQLCSGRWTSKLGELEDIEHGLHDLEGTEYGSVVLVMKRPVLALGGKQAEAR